MSTALVALAALFWGLSGGIGGILLAAGWQAPVVAFYRGAIGLLFVLVWFLLRPGNRELLNRRLWFWSVMAGIGIAGNFGFYFLSISRGSVAVAATLMYCAPVFVYLVSFLLKLERPRPFKWVAMGLVMVGVVLLTRVYQVGAEGVSVIAAVAGLLSGLSYALFIFGLKFAAPHGSPQGILVIAFSVLVVLLLGPADGGEIVSVLGSASWFLFAALGVLGAGVSFIFYVVGLRRTAPAIASLLAMVEPVTASLFGVLVLDERLLTLQVIGMALILVTVTGLSVTSK